MFSRSTLLHLRIPFSLYLMPVFCFAVSASTVNDFWVLLIAFIAIHLFLYPASNGFNSYYDKDEGSIGGLEHPPVVDRGLLYTSLLFDLIAILLGLVISWQFALMLFIYGMVSKAYSHDLTRLKKHGIISLLTAAVFQGGFTFMMTYLALNSVSFGGLTQPRLLLAAVLSSLMIMAFYPMTQVYQHEEDARRGDYTISLRLGIIGTFIFSAIVFALALGGFFFYFDRVWFGLFFLFLLPVLVFFFSWFWRVWKDASAADFHSTMKLNRIASLSLIGFFVLRFVVKEWNW